MIKDLIKLSNHLDAKGLRKEADYLDAVIRKAAGNAAHEKSDWFHEQAVESGALGQAVAAQGFEYQTKTHNSQRGTLSYLYIQNQDDGSVARITLAYDTFMRSNQQSQEDGQ